MTDHLDYQTEPPPSEPPSNRRQAQRMPCPASPLPGVLHVGETPCEVQIVDVSTTGFGLEAAEGGVGSIPIDKGDTALLQAEDWVHEVRVAFIGRQSGGTKIGVERIAEVPLSELQQAEQTIWDLLHLPQAATRLRQLLRRIRHLFPEDRPLRVGLIAVALVVIVLLSAGHLSGVRLDFAEIVDRVADAERRRREAQNARPAPPPTAPPASPAAEAEPGVPRSFVSTTIPVPDSGGSNIPWSPEETRRTVAGLREAWRSMSDAGGSLVKSTAGGLKMVEGLRWEEALRTFAEDEASDAAADSPALPPETD